MARTLAEAQAMRTLVYAAWVKALGAESYSESSASGGVSVSRARLSELKKQLDDLDEEIGALSGGGIRIVAATPID